MKRIFTYICFISICVCSHAQWTIEQVEKGSSSKNDIRAICFDRVGNLWLGTSYGVYAYALRAYQLAACVRILPSQLGFLVPRCRVGSSCASSSQA